MIKFIFIIYLIYISFRLSAKQLLLDLFF